MRTIFFPEAGESIKSRLCFVLMPFSKGFNPVYARIKSLLESNCGLQCLRADEMFGSHPIVENIWTSLNEARFLIADLTGRNPNVFYELGLAHAVQKNVLLLTQELKDVPFDVHHIRVIQYDTSLSGGFDSEFVEAARSYISTIPPRWMQPDVMEARAPLVKITRLDIPYKVKAGQPFEIVVTARNMDNKAREGYFSLSFPDGVDVGFPPSPQSQVQCGSRGGKWCNGQVRLQYPIIERFDIGWQPGIEHLLRFQGYQNKRGLLWVYISASSRIPNSKKWDYDYPHERLDIDQRREPVYCAAIEIE